MGHASGQGRGQGLYWDTKSRDPTFLPIHDETLHFKLKALGWEGGRIEFRQLYAVHATVP